MRTQSLWALRGKIVVLEWTNHECPYVRKHYGANNMQNLQREVTGAGAQVHGHILRARAARLCPAGAGQQSDQDPQRGAHRRAARPQGHDGPCLFCADDTPHVRHQPAGHADVHGGIHSIATTRAADLQQAIPYLHDAFRAVMEGKPVQNAVTRPYGCSIKYSA